MLSHRTIFTKLHNSQSSAHAEINEIFNSADKYFDYLLTNAEGTPSYTELLYLAGEVQTLKKDLNKMSDEEGRLAAREFRNVFTIACNPNFSTNEKVKQLELFRNHMRGSSMSTKERLTRDSMLFIGLALVPIIAIVATAILCTPLSLIALGAAIPIFAIACVLTGLRNSDEMRFSNPSGEKLSNNMISLIKNRQHLFSPPKTPVAPPSYEQVKYGLA